jgi:branched-chain amino acid transport system substrate-binding protein
MKRISILIIFSIMISIVLSGCESYDNFITGMQPEDKSEPTVRIGVFEPLTGADAEYGELEKRGIELAHELYPKAVEKPVELIFEDNKSNPDNAALAAKKLVEKRVAVVLGSYGSSNSMIGGVEFEKAKIPAIAITCTNPLVTSINEYYFRVCFIDTFQGVAMAKYAFNKVKAKTVAVISESDNDFSTTLGEVFSEKFISLTKNENSIVSITKYKVNDKDFASQINAIKTAKPDVIFITGKPLELALIVKQARDAGIKSQFLGINTIEDIRFIKISGEAGEGVVFSTLYDPNIILSEKTTEFLNAYHKKYGEEAIPTKEEALGFDSYLVAINAINAAGTAINGDLIKEKLILTQQLHAVTGEITFDQNKDAVKTVIIKTIRNGEFLYQSTIVPVWE